MSSLETTLDKFVTKIPFCHVNDSGENILKALCSSPRGFIAIIDANFCPLGILETQKLLVQIANKTIISVNSSATAPQSLSDIVASLATNKLTNLISRITALSSQIRIKDLIALLNSQEAPISEQNYFIIDAAGKVQGILDLPQLLKHIAQDYAVVNTQNDRLSAASDLLKLPSPLVLHDGESKIYEQSTAGNRYFPPQQEVALTQSLNNSLAQVPTVGIQPVWERDKLRRLQNELMVNMSHDLKSPLTAIISLSSLLREEKLGSLNPRQIRYLELIYGSGRQLMTIITELLDLTSLVTGKLRLKLETIELEEFCKQAFQQVATRLKTFHNHRQNKPLVLPEFQFHLESDSSAVMADRLRLNQILLRLLENAVRATPVEGTVGIRVERWDDEWVAITVWDQGRGISESFQPSLLEEMFEPDNLLISPKKTTSLGLILAQQLAQSQGGDISFTSQINHGSEFTLLLPANPLKMSNPENICLEEELPSAGNHHHQSTLVLIVERSAMRIRDLTENLHKLGYHTAIARNQQEALYKATRLQPSKIILNHELVNPTGQNIFTTLKSDPQTSHIPLLLISQHRSNSDYLYFPAEHIFLSPQEQINPEVLIAYFPTLTSQHLDWENLGTSLGQYHCSGKKLTMLRLCLTSEDSSLTGSEIDFLFDDPSVNLCHHIIEADSIEQANMLARIWKIDTIIWDNSHLELPLDYLRSLSTCPKLAQIPIVTLDEQTTAAANQFNNLNVFPCLVPINEQNITELMQIIQSAATSMSNLS